MNKSKKGLAVAMSSMLALSLLSACTGGGKGNDAANSPGSSNAPSSPAASSAKPSELPPPAKLTFEVYHVNSDTMDNFDQTPVGKVIKEKLNITLKIRGSQNPAQDLVTDIAANNLPDFFVIGGTTQNLDLMNKAANENVLADLSALVQKNAPVLQDTVKPERLPALTQSVIFNPDFKGKLFFLPTYYSAQAPGVNGFGLYLRGDIAKALNVDTKSIQTEDDLYNLARKIKDGNFKDVNGKPVYPFGMIAPWREHQYVTYRQYDYGKTGFALIDGKIKSYIESDEIWKQILFTRKMISEGLLDPETFSQTYQVGSDKVSQGRYALMPFLAAAVVPGSQAVMKALTDPHPEMTYVGLSPIKDFRGAKEQLLNKGGETPYLIGVSKKADAEAVIRLLNWLNTKEGKATAYYGAQGQQWSFNNKGYAQMTDEAYKELRSDTKAFVSKIGAGSNLLNILAQITGFSDDPKYDILGGNHRTPFYQNAPDLSDKQLAYVDQVMPNIVVKNQFEINGLLANFPGKDKLSPILLQQDDTLARAYLVKDEKGAKEVLDGYRDTLNKNGFQDYIKYLQQEYDKDPKKYLVETGAY